MKTKSIIAFLSILIFSVSNLNAQHNHNHNHSDRCIHSKGYAAIDTTGKLAPFSFERRMPGDSDVVIEIMYSGVCHSNVHQARGHWGNSHYPMVPGHEIAGRVFVGQ